MRSFERRWISLENKKARFLIGLSMKAGKIASGEFAVEKAVKQGTAHLVILAEDASGPAPRCWRNILRKRSDNGWKSSNNSRKGRCVRCQKSGYMSLPKS